MRIFQLSKEGQKRGMTGYANEGHNIHHLAWVYLKDSTMIRLSVWERKCISKIKDLFKV